MPWSGAAASDAYLAKLKSLDKRGWVDISMWPIIHNSDLPKYNDATERLYSTADIGTRELATEIGVRIRTMCSAATKGSRGGRAMDDAVLLAKQAAMAWMMRYEIARSDLETMWLPVETIMPLRVLDQVDQYRMSGNYGPNTEKVVRFIDALLRLSPESIAYLGADERFALQDEPKVREAAESLVRAAKSHDLSAELDAAMIDAYDAVAFASRGITFGAADPESWDELSEDLRSKLHWMATLKQACWRAAAAAGSLVVGAHAQSRDISLLNKPFAGMLPTGV